MFFDFAIHDFDTIRFLSNSEIEEVFAAGAVLVDPEIGNAGDIDTAIITLRLANGALCVIDNSRQARYGYDQRFEAFGSKGNLVVDNTRPTIQESFLEGGVYTDLPPNTLRRTIPGCIHRRARGFREAVSARIGRSRFRPTTLWRPSRLPRRRRNRWTRTDR